jgi:hypothetical protein
MGERVPGPLMRQASSITSRARSRSVMGLDVASAPLSRAAPIVDAAFDIDTMDARPLVSPADPTGALGVAFAVAAVNVRVAVYDRAGGTAMAPIRLRLISGPNSNIARLQETDPRVFYDPYRDVFVLVFLAYNAKNGFIEVVTMPGDTADDRSTWCRLHLSGDQVPGDGRQFADYPTVGFSKNRVTVATNNFDFSTLTHFEYTQLISMKKTQLYDPTCSRPVRLSVLSGQQMRDPDGSKAFTVQSARSIGPPTRDQFLVSVDPERRSTQLVLWRLRFDRGAAKLVRTALTVKRAFLPPYGYQCGSTSSNPDTWWDTGDLRLTDAWYDGDSRSLYTAHAVLGNAGGGEPESVIRWYEVAVAGALGRSDVNRTGVVARQNFDAGWPSVATTDDGTLWITFARAGMSECLSAAAASVQAGAVGSSQTLIAEGLARYEFSARDPFTGDPGIERWGDFSATNRDPLHPAAIGSFNAYAKDGTGGTTLAWQARASRLTAP